ncbi:Beta-hexosaminidase [Raoultella terrigena]|uniref:beta-N-acetylhexosaminidase n=1 Tax=Raoultella terrigena TaxID=577 RepID=A0A3P8M4Y6_RAOTE|nr:Beta-hexosaminidase [Raoultella terrigena]
MAIFPDSYLHIGGDEVDDSQWRANPAIQKFMRGKGLADSHALQAYFNRRLETILEKYHRQMVGWDEIYHPDLPKSILIQSWQGLDALGEVAKHGYRGILSTGFYLDQPQYTAYHYRNEVVPQGLNGVDTITDNDSAQSWSFVMPRLKGSAVEGSFTLIKGESGWRGFIDFKGKSRRAVQDIAWLNDNQITFSVDTWMGETRPVLTVNDDRLGGYFLLGNARYPVSGQRLDEVPEGIPPVVPDAEQQKNLLGGEAALWAENVAAPVLDIKLWPRAFRGRRAAVVGAGCQRQRQHVPAPAGNGRLVNGLGRPAAARPAAGAVHAAWQTAAALWRCRSSPRPSSRRTITRASI